jgi:hypothetical protein
MLPTSNFVESKGEPILLFLNEKGNPILKITTLLRSCKPMDVIIVSRENRGHPLPQSPRGLAQGII